MRNHAFKGLSGGMAAVTQRGVEELILDKGKEI